MYMAQQFNLGKMQQTTNWVYRSRNFQEPAGHLHRYYGSTPFTAQCRYTPIRIFAAKTQCWSQNLEQQI